MSVKSLVQIRPGGAFEFYLRVGQDELPLQLLWSETELTIRRPNHSPIGEDVFGAVLSVLNGGGPVMFKQPDPVAWQQPHTGNGHSYVQALHPAAPPETRSVSEQLRAGAREVRIPVPDKAALEADRQKLREAGFDIPPGGGRVTVLDKQPDLDKLAKEGAREAEAMNLVMNGQARTREEALALIAVEVADGSRDASGQPVSQDEALPQIKRTQRAAPVEPPGEADDLRKAVADNPPPAKQRGRKRQEKPASPIDTTVPTQPPVQPTPDFVGDRVGGEGQTWFDQEAEREARKIAEFGRAYGATEETIERVTKQRTGDFVGYAPEEAADIDRQASAAVDALTQEAQDQGFYDDPPGPRVVKETDLIDKLLVVLGDPPNPNMDFLGTKDKEGVYVDSLLMTVWFGRRIAVEQRAAMAAGADPKRWAADQQPAKLIDLQNLQKGAEDFWRIVEALHERSPNALTILPMLMADEQTRNMTRIRIAEKFNKIAQGRAKSAAAQGAQPRA